MCHQNQVRITSGVNSSSSISVTELEFVDYLIIKTLTQSNQKLLKQLLNVFLIWNWETFNDFEFVIPAFARGYRGKWWRRGGFNPLHFRLHPYFTFNPLVLLVLRHQKIDWYEVGLWFDSHQTITKSNIITLTKYISKKNPHIYASSNLVFFYNAQ